MMDKYRYMDVPSTTPLFKIQTLQILTVYCYYFYILFITLLKCQIEGIID